MSADGDAIKDTRFTQLKESQKTGTWSVDVVEGVGWLGLKSFSVYFTNGEPGTQIVVVALSSLSTLRSSGLRKLSRGRKRWEINEKIGRSSRSSYFRTCGICAAKKRFILASQISPFTLFCFLPFYCFGFVIRRRTHSRFRAPPCAPQFFSYSSHLRSGRGFRWNPVKVTRANPRYSIPTYFNAIVASSTTGFSKERQGLARLSFSPTK